MIRSKNKRLAVALATTLVLGGCFDGGGSASQETNTVGPTASPPATPNSPPSISGVPTTTAIVGNPWAFTPNASDPDGDSLNFSIAGKPAWASFNVSTGQLSGTPGEGDVGLYENIVITVSDGEMEAMLPAFSIEVLAVATGSATLMWTPPTRNTDGSQLTNLAAYKFYYGPSEGNYPNHIRVDNPGISSYVIDDLPPGTHYFVATVINSDGIESQFSNVATKTIPNTP